jgi:phosphate transport system permease protein
MSHASFSGSAGAASAAPADSPVGRNNGPLGPVELTKKKRFGAETVFRSVSTASGAAVLVIIVAIATFLIVQAIPALRADTVNFFTFKQWFPDSTPSQFGIAAIAFGTVYTSAIAVVLSVPVALGIALCLSHYAPKGLARVLGFVIDLLAAVPSIIFGLWGRDYLRGPIKDLSGWLHHYFGWIPIFGSDGPYGQSILLGSLVLAIMMLPIITSLSREVFMQTPRMNEEAALALGATKWEVIRTAVIPYGRPGIIAAVILGLGRALGETIALALTLSSTFVISFDVINVGGNTVAANIANTFGEAGTVGRGALIASGLVLFVITLIVNMIARGIVYRRREFLGSAA